jgi:hypothetical protein
VSVLVCSADVRREVDTVAGLDDVLDAIAANGEPILVELAGKSTVMNVGVGRKDVAVVSFRDADGRPWCARSGDDWSNAGADLEFAKLRTARRVGSSPMPLSLRRRCEERRGGSFGHLA